MNKKKIPTILFAAHDAGGANAIGSLLYGLKKNSYFKCILWAKGYAKDIFLKYDLTIDRVFLENECFFDNFYDSLLKVNPNIIITGTSANDFFEKLIWETAKAADIFSVAIIDQWMNYGIRFSKYTMKDNPKIEDSFDFTYIPNEIWVMDEDVKKIYVNNGLAENAIKVTGQPYFQYVKLFFRPNNNEVKKVLFISEPLKETYGSDQKVKQKKGYTEYEIISNVIETFRELNNDSKIFISVRLHPKDSVNKYDNLFSILKSKDKKIEFSYDDEPDNIKSILSSDLVVGMTSMMLLEAILLGKPILSVQINLKETDEFVLSQMGIVDTIVTKIDLLYEIQKCLDGELDFLKKEWVFIDNANDIILNRIEEILCVN